MKRKVLAIAMVAALCMVQPFAAFAAGSSSSSSSSGDSVWTTPSTTTQSGTATTTADGQSLTTNGAGANTAGAVAEFAVGGASTAGLPTQVVSSINSINSGADLATAVGNKDLSGYAALTTTAAVVVKDATTKTVKNEPTTVTLYIPNLVEGLQNVKILYYENATGLWKVVDPSAIDFNKKTVTFTMIGSGTVTVIHK